MRHRAVASRTAAGGGAFTDPSDVAGLEVWLDAQVGTTGDDPITAWADQSGNGNDAIITAVGARPNFDALYEINAIPAITIADGAELYTPISGIGSDMSVFIVFQRIGGDGQLFDIRNSGDGTPLVDDGAQAGFGVRRRNDGGSIPFDLVGKDASPHLYRAVVDASGAGTFDFWLDGVLKSASPSAAGTTTGLNRLYIGRAWTGILGEVLLYDSALGSTDIDDIEDYLATKWGITI